MTEIDPVGEVFDPHVSEAVMQVPAEEGETAGTVKQVVQKGTDSVRISYAWRASSSSAEINLQNTNRKEIDYYE